MEPASLRQLLALLFIVFLFSPSTQANTIFNADEIRPRFEAMDCMIAPRYTSEVESYIKRNLAYNGSNAKRIMARASVYFPIYEKYLKEHNLPQDLKFLSIVESSLNPNAVSPVGASGLWQFMSVTGRSYCLTIDKNVDERLCPYNSTEAAMQYLAKQYQRFGSWELAIASYNCGPGTINNAIKRARSNNYWTISKYLPRETRNFVPAFLGATYIGNFYHTHNIQPEYPSLDMQITEALKIYQKLDFTTIAAVAGLPMEVISKLNPAYKKDFIPENTEGFDLILPRRVSSAMVEYLEATRPDGPRKIALPPLPALVDTASYKPDELYFSSIYVVAEGDAMGELADVFNIAPYNIKVWNNLTTYRITKGQELTIWFPTELRHFLQNGEKIDVPVMPRIMSTTVKETVPEEAFIRDNLPLPNEIPTAMSALTASPAVAQSLRVVSALPTPRPAGGAVRIKLDKFNASVKKAKELLPKQKEKPAATPTKNAPKMMQRTSEPSGHGIN